MKKTVLTFGLISGAIISVMMLATVPFQEQIGVDKGEVIGYTTMILSFMLVYFGVRSYRDNVRGGRITFGRAFAVGTLITALSCVCYVATWEVIYHNFMPDFAEKYASAQIQKVKASGASQQAIDRQMAEMKKFQTMYRNPFFNVAMTFVEPLPVGLVIALVSAGVLSRKPRPPVLASSTSPVVSH